MLKCVQYFDTCQIFKHVVTYKRLAAEIHLNLSVSSMLKSVKGVTDLSQGSQMGVTHSSAGFIE